MSKAPRPPASKNDGGALYERNDKVLVARTNGGWTEAVVLNVDTRKREYSVCFSSANKAVHKQISFDHAKDHLLPPSREQGTAFSRIPKAEQAEVERICHEVFKGRDLQDAVQSWLRKRSGSYYLTPYGMQKLGRFTGPVGELLEHLTVLERSSKVDEYRLIADWAAGKVRPLPSSSPTRTQEPLVASPPFSEPSPSPVPPPRSVERIDTEEDVEGSPEVVMSASPSPAHATNWGTIDKHMKEMLELAEELHRNAQIGSPSDADIEHRAEMMKERDAIKDEIIKELREMPNMDKPPDHIIPNVEALVTSLSREGDQNPANVSLMRTLIERVDVDFAKVMQDEGLLVEQCTDGNVEFFKLFLTCKGAHAAYDPVEVVASAVYSQTARVPLSRIVLTEIKYEDHIDEVQRYFNELFTNITTEAQRKNKEDLTGLYELLEALIVHDGIKIDLSATDSSEMTVLGRCCASGDMQLLELLATHKPDIVRPTDELPDGTTPMIQAIIKDKVDVVKRLLTFPNCDVDKESKLGTALGLAEAMKRAEIEALLRDAGATVSKFNNE